MNTLSKLDLSTIDHSRLDTDSLRLIVNAVEAEAKRMRAEAVRDVLRTIGRYVRVSLSIRTSPRRANA